MEDIKKENPETNGSAECADNGIGTEADTPTPDTVGEEESEGKKKKCSKGDAKKLKAELDAARGKAEELEGKLAEAEDKYMRTLAEYDNFRRRTAKERENIYRDAVADTLENILPLIDNLLLASKYTEGERVAEGVKMILDKVPEALAKINVTAFGAPGDKFDPTLHNAVMHEDDGSRGEGEITDVFQVGYKLGDTVIRYAMVKVVN